MKLLLINFGTYEKKQFDFKSNQFTLFKGENGSGKSTIFKAICFALYDKFKTVRHTQETCQVTLQDQNWIIKRTSKPRILKVQIDTLILEGASAQELIINKIMKMTWEQFCLCTMIQESKSLVSITAGERFSVVRDLVSCLDKPVNDAEKILAYEKSLKEQFTFSSGEMSVLRAQLDKYSDCEEIQFDKDQYNESRERLEILLTKREKWISILSTGIPKDEAQLKLEKLDSVKTIKSKIQKLTNNLQYVRQIDQIKKLKEDFEIGRKDYFERIKNELKELKDYNEANLKEIAMETQIRLSLKDDGNPYWEWSPEEIKKVDLRSVSLKQTRQQCPCCNNFVAIEKGKIIEWETNWNKESNITTDIMALQKLKYPLDLKAPEKWEMAVKTRLRKAELTRILKDEILSSELIRMKKSFGEKISEPQGYKEFYTIEYLEDRIQTLTKELGTCPKESEREMLETIVSTKKYPTKEGLEKITKEISELTKKCDKMRDDMDKYKLYQEYSNLKEKIKIISEKEANIKLEMVAIERIKILQKEAEIMSMQNIIDTINSYAEEYLVKFFDNTITVTLDVIKKTAKNVKMSLEMNILYGGQPYNIHEFSQGELIKINLAFILAMNRLQQSSYLFLDEVLQNLDKGVLLEIYACLKQLNISVYVIDHNSIEGFFDEIIEFQK